MARNFSELWKKMTPESQDRAKARADEMLKEMALTDLRRARELTQQQLASNLNVNQAWISKVERQTDMYLSTLRAYIEAMGGKLDIIARFDEGAVTVCIDQLKGLGSQNIPALPSGKGSSHQTNVDVREGTVSVWTSTPENIPIYNWKTERNTTGRSRTPKSNTIKAAA